MFKKNQNKVRATNVWAQDVRNTFGVCANTRGTDFKLC
jgi:hypothetical protein